MPPHASARSLRWLLLVALASRSLDALLALFALLAPVRRGAREATATGGGRPTGSRTRGGTPGARPGEKFDVKKFDGEREE